MFVSWDEVVLGFGGRFWGVGRCDFGLWGFEVVG